MSVIKSGKNYVAECPTVGAWGVMTNVETTRSFGKVEESFGVDGELDGHILSGYKQEVSADYSYLTGATGGPETLIEDGTLLTLTDLSTGGQLPAKLLLTEVVHKFTGDGGKASASIKGVYAAYMAAL